MSDWFEFALYVLTEIVGMVFDWNLDLGFSVGDLIVACAVIGVVVSALVVKSSHISSSDSKFNIPIGKGKSND